MYRTRWFRYSADKEKLALELEANGRTGLPHNPCARRSEPKIATLYFWSPSEDSCRVIMGGATGFLLRVYGPYCCLRHGYRMSVC